ncbi:MAG: hypothetical protein QOD07_2431 [Frankiaceae bacterium]|jgi:hypothetical protein|nr:hypothetical protein [Frankiaceae bacterium]
MTSPLAQREQLEFTVFYDGPALAEHRMSVRDLAPALIGLADLLQEASAALSPGEPSPSLDIKATNEGSFLIELSVIHERILHLLSSPDALSLAVLVTLTTGANGLLSLLKRKRESNRQEELANGGLRITLPDNTTIEYPPSVIVLSHQPGVRRAVQAVIAPLNREGIDALEIREAPQGPATVRITSDDLPAIEAAIAEEGRSLITDQRYTATLTITSPNFQAGKWRLNDGQNNYWMKVEDPQFQGRIDRHEVKFGKDDRLRAEVWFRQWESDSGEIQTERSVTRVDDFLQAPPVPAQTAIDDHIEPDET